MVSNISQKYQEGAASLAYLPSELRFMILSYITGQIVEGICDSCQDCFGKSTWKPRIKLREGDIDIISKILSKTFIPHIFDEFQRLAWKKSWKKFESPSELTLFSLSLGWRNLNHVPLNKVVSEQFNNAQIDDSAVPNFKISSVPSPLTGNEKMVLDFGAEEYFYAFRVCVPPFNRPSEYVNDFEIGAGIFLRPVKHLVIRFGERYTNCHAWSDVVSPEWHEEFLDAEENPWIPRLGANICSQGTVIDWILSFAWYHGFLQPIAKVELEGDLQPWVRQKWEEIFQRRRQEEGFVHEVDMGGIMELENDDGQPWIHYPPRCECKHKCKRLSMGLAPETEEAGQADGEPWPSEEAQGDGGRWLDSVDNSDIW